MVYLVGMRGRIQSLGDQARMVQGERSVQSWTFEKGGLCLTGLGWGQGCLHHNLWWQIGLKWGEGMFF